MNAKLSISSVKVPHNGRFVDCKVVASKVFGVPNGATGELQNKVVHLEVQRYGGPYLVLKLDREAALEVGRQMVALAEGIK